MRRRFLNPWEPNHFPVVVLRIMGVNHLRYMRGSSNTHSSVTPVIGDRATEEAPYRGLARFEEHAEPRAPCGSPALPPSRWSAHQDRGTAVQEMRHELWLRFDRIRSKPLSKGNGDQESGGTWATDASILSRGPQACPLH